MSEIRRLQNDHKFMQKCCKTTVVVSCDNVVSKLTRMEQTVQQKHLKNIVRLPIHVSNSEARD